MSVIIDTDVAIWLRDEPASIRSFMAALEEPPSISAITRVELEGGVYAKQEVSHARRLAVDALLRSLPVIDFTDSIAEVYGAIVRRTGFSRRKVSDRMIAATALAHRATLVTFNARDYRDIPGLDLLAWALPA